MVRVHRVLCYHDTVLVQSCCISWHWHHHRRFLPSITRIIVSYWSIQVSILSLIHWWRLLRHDRDCSSLCTVRTCQLFWMSCLLNAGLFGTAWLATCMPRLVVVHDGLVNEIGTVDELTLTSTTVLLIQKCDTIMHMNGSLWGRWHPTVLLLKHHSLHWLGLFDVHSIDLSLASGFWIDIVRVFWALHLAAHVDI